MTEVVAFPKRGDFFSFRKRPFPKRVVEYKPKGLPMKENSSLTTFHTVGGECSLDYILDALTVSFLSGVRVISSGHSDQRRGGEEDCFGNELRARSLLL